MDERTTRRGTNKIFIEINSFLKKKKLKILQTEVEKTESESEDLSVEEWSKEQLRKRSRELQLVDLNGDSQPMKIKSFISTCDSRLDEVTFSEIENESKSASRSTTSDSQVQFSINIFFF